MLTEEAVQIMDSQGQFAVLSRVSRVATGHFNPLGRSMEPGAERQMLIGIAQGGQQAANLVHPPNRTADRLQGLALAQALPLHSFEQQAFKLTAMRWPVGVNPATAVAISRAGLQKMRCFRALWFGAAARWGLNFAAWFQANAQFQGTKPRRIIGGLQLQIRKDHAVATHPASQAEPARGTPGEDCGLARIHTIQAKAPLRGGRAKIVIIEQS